MSDELPESPDMSIDQPPQEEAGEIYFDPTEAPQVSEEPTPTEAPKQEVPVAVPNVEVYYPFDTGEPCPVTDTIALPPGDEKMIREAIERMPNDTTADNGHERNWKSLVRNSVGYIPYAEQWVSRLADPNAHFTHCNAPTVSVFRRYIRHQINTPAPWARCI